MILIKEQSTQLFTVPQHIGRQQVKQPGPGALFRPEDLKSPVSDTARAESSTIPTVQPQSVYVGSLVGKQYRGAQNCRVSLSFSLVPAK